MLTRRHVLATVPAVAVFSPMFAAIEAAAAPLTYTLTPEGQRFAITYTKLGNRVLPPLLAANQPPAPIELRQALRTIDRHVNDYLANARLKTAA